MRKPISDKPTKHANNRSKKKIFFLTFSVIFITALTAIGGYATYSYWTIQEKLKAQAVKLDTKPVVRDSDGKEIKEFEGAFNLLIVGSDERDSATPSDTTETLLNDVNLLVHVTEDHKRISIVSFPRDLMIQMPECDGKYSYGDVQINTALRTGGLSCVVKTIENLTGFSIPYAALVNFQSVVSITNQIGGVPVCLATPIRDTNTGQVNISSGDIILDGHQALTFVRSRYGIGNGSDLNRINNQQVFMKNAISKIVNEGVLTDPVKTVNVANILLDNTKVSESLADINTLLSLARVVQQIGVNNIGFYTIPYTSYPADRNRVGLDEEGAKKILNDITLPTEEPIVEVETVKIPSNPITSSKNSSLLNVIASPPISKQVELPVLEGGTEFIEKNAAGVYCGQGSGY